MKVIRWPGYGMSRVEVYRVFDLSGITYTPRQSKLFIKSGYAYVDGNKVNNIKETIEVGKPVLLSIKFPNGIVKEELIMVILRQYYEGTPQRKVFE